jgi:hypothetical protein
MYNKIKITHGWLPFNFFKAQSKYRNELGGGWILDDCDVTQSTSDHWSVVTPILKGLCISSVAILNKVKGSTSLIYRLNFHNICKFNSMTRWNDCVGPPWIHSWALDKFQRWAFELALCMLSMFAESCLRKIPGKRNNFVFDVTVLTLFIYAVCSLVKFNGFIV